MHTHPFTISLCHPICLIVVFVGICRPPLTYGGVCLLVHSKELQQRLRTLLHQLITPTLGTIFKVFLLENATTYLFSWMNHDEGNQVESVQAMDITFVI